MATRADPAADIGAAANRLIEACAGAACIRFEPDQPFDALAAGVVAIAGIYERADLPPRGKTRSKK